MLLALSLMLGVMSLAAQPAGRQTYAVNGVQFTMVTVPGGTFTMGASGGRIHRTVGEQEHEVTLSAYAIGETEVTQALWEVVMGSNPSYWRGGNLPVEQVTWKECQEFIETLNLLTGLAFRLPTEAEWEYAARGGPQSDGHPYSGSDALDDVAWHDGNSGGKTHPVGRKQANELGLYDMSGNVGEWCQDRHGGYASRSQVNPRGAASGGSHVFRGGGWDAYPKDCRVEVRSSATPMFRSSSALGLRLAL